MKIGEAIEAMLSGYYVQRAGWNGPGQYIALQVPDAQSKMTLPYIYIRTVQADLVPWLASQTDILADDWRVVELRQRFITVIADLPQSQSLEASVAIALKEVRANVADILNIKDA